MTYISQLKVFENDKKWKRLCHPPITVSLSCCRETREGNEVITAENKNHNLGRKKI